VNSIVRGRALVTGAAGFIGSWLVERLLAEGREVVGVDCFTDYYARDLKEANLAGPREDTRFSFHELDLSSDPLDGLLAGVEDVFHLAAQAGVRGSFGEGFDRYVRWNVVATQRLLEQAVVSPVSSFVYASSSSVYGNAPPGLTTESTTRQPVSPYGMTKLATEEIANVYHRNHGIRVVGLRYFTVYGPRQRPDMAFTRFLSSVLAGEPLEVYGDGRQVRDFSYVDDAVTATIAATRGRAGAIYNISGGAPVELNAAIAMIGELLEREVQVNRRSASMGDARHTRADISLATRELGWMPTTSLREGLTAQLLWLTSPKAEALSLASSRATAAGSAP
jgi:nucleoside-diphosphate-sugar epimerase